MQHDVVRVSYIRVHRSVGASRQAALLVALIYALFALAGLAGLGQALGGHAASEMLHLPGSVYTYAVGAQGTGADATRTARLGQSSAAPGVTAASSFTPAAEFPLEPASPRGAAIVAHWIGLIIAGLDLQGGDRMLPWPDAPTQGAVLNRFHRSVVLHL